jgi:RNA binding exosome subunit
LIIAVTVTHLTIPVFLFNGAAINQQTGQSTLNPISVNHKGKLLYGRSKHKKREKRGKIMHGAGDITKAMAYIDIRVFAHATEDTDKVQTAVRNLLPEELAQTIVFQKTSLTGHHGNPIVIFRARLTDKKTLPFALAKIGSGLSSLDKEELCRDLKLHLEKRNLYLRCDKQFAFLGNTKFTQNDPIHFKIHFKNKTPEEIKEICTSTGLLP